MDRVLKSLDHRFEMRYTGLERPQALVRLS